MAQVTVKINGYAYTVGCEDGQEDHLTAMAAEVEGRIDSIKALGNPSGEARLLVLASLLMADELHDMRVELETLRLMLPRPGVRRVGAERPDPETGRRLSRMATRAEQIATSLEQPPHESGARGTADEEEVLAVRIQSLASSTPPR